MTRFTALAVALCLAPLTAGCNFGSDYGKKLDFKGGEVYYTTNVTEADAKKLGEYLEKIGQFKESKKSSVQLDSADGVYQIRMVVIDDYKTLKDYPGVYQMLGARVSAKVFDGKPVAIHFTDSKLKTIEVLEARTVGSLIEYDKSELIFSHGVTKDEATKVGDHLKKTKYFDNPTTVCLRKDGDTFQVLFVANLENVKKKPVLKSIYRLRGRMISTAALGGKPVEVHLVDGVLKNAEVLKPLKGKDGQAKKPKGIGAT